MDLANTYLKAEQVKNSQLSRKINTYKFNRQQVLDQREDELYKQYQNAIVTGSVFYTVLNSNTPNITYQKLLQKLPKDVREQLPPEYDSDIVKSYYTQAMAQAKNYAMYINSARSVNVGDHINEYQFGIKTDEGQNIYASNQSPWKQNPQAKFNLASTEKYVDGQILDKASGPWANTPIQSILGKMGLGKTVTGAIAYAMEGIWKKSPKRYNMGSAFDAAQREMRRLIEEEVSKTESSDLFKNANTEQQVRLKEAAVLHAINKFKLKYRH